MENKPSEPPIVEQTESIAHIGIIGGYGISDDIEIDRRIDVNTPYGDSTHPVYIGDFGTKKVAFVSRHGEGRRIPSHQINYRANLYALRRLGVRRVVTATANGSYRRRLSPGDIAIPDDYIDATKCREDTFFDGSPAIHVSAHNPFCPEIREELQTVVEDVGFEAHTEVTAVILEGPRFFTTAESRMYRQAGADIVGGSTYPEMTLARELGMCYANFALITDYDNADMIDGIDSDPVTIEQINEYIQDYGDRCTNILQQTVNRISDRPCSTCSDWFPASA